jgi:hypothetical protein
MNLVFQIVPFALNHAMHYVECMIGPELHVVQDEVQGCHAPNVVHGGVIHDP